MRAAVDGFTESAPIASIAPCGTASAAGPALRQILSRPSPFTYQFFPLWIDTQTLGTDTYATVGERVNFYTNTLAATQATRDYVRDNPADRATGGLAAAPAAGRLRGGESVRRVPRRDRQRYDAPRPSTKTAW